MPARKRGQKPTLSEQQQQLKRRKRAVGKFRPRKSDRGKVIFIGTEGKRPHKRESKGWAVYVTKSGKKKPLKSLKGLAPQRRDELSLKLNKVLRNPLHEFEQRTLTENIVGRPVIRKRLHPPKAGNLFGARKPNETDEEFANRTYKAAANYGKLHKPGEDFNDAVIDKLARNLKGAFKNKGFRNFSILTKVLIETPEGELEVVEFRVPIARRDNIAVQLAGLKNFIRLKFYAFLAHELATLGYVSSGSANHIRQLPENAGKMEEEFTKEGKQWDGRYREQVFIRNIQWQVQQL